MTFPWADADEVLGEQLVSGHFRAVTDVRLAVLDRSFAYRAAPFPEVGIALTRRAVARAWRSAAASMIIRKRPATARVLGMLRHLAERWGECDPTGSTWI